MMIMNTFLSAVWPSVSYACLHTKFEAPNFNHSKDMIWSIWTPSPQINKFTLSWCDIARNRVITYNIT